MRNNSSIISRASAGVDFVCVNYWIFSTIPTKSLSSGKNATMPSNPAACRMSKCGDGQSALESAIACSSRWQKPYGPNYGGSAYPVQRRCNSFAQI